MPENQKIKQIRIGDNTYDVEPKNSEVLASSHITDALGYTPANSATAVTHTASTAVGSATKPVYVASNGAATACTYSLNTDVPSGAVFTDHITTVASSGTGNFVTGMTADANGKITYTKGTALTASDIANNVTTATSGKVLDAYQGKVLNDKIAAIEGRGRYLSIWDASTGKPNDLPGGGSSTTEVYTYKTGDYFIVKAAGNKVPSGTSIPVGTTIATFPSTDGGSSDINDTIYFNGTTWSVLHVPAGSGDVTGPASSVNNDLAAFDGTTGKVIKDSGISISTVDAKIENVNIGSIQGTVSSHISNFEAQAAGNLAIKDTASIADLASDVTALINNKVSKSGDTMTGDLYVPGYPTTLVAGQTYHLHIPAGTDCSSWLGPGENYIQIAYSSITNVSTAIPLSTREGGNPLVIGCCAGSEYWAGISLAGGATGYNMQPASADFDCDFVYSWHMGTLGSQILPYITRTSSRVATEEDVAAKVSKSGDTISTDASIALGLTTNTSGTYPKLGFGTYGGVTDCYIQGPVYHASSDLTLSTDNGNINISGDRIILSPVGATSTIDNIAVPHGTTGKTFATVDQIPSTSNFVKKSGDTMTGTLAFSSNTPPFFKFPQGNNATLKILQTPAWMYGLHIGLETPVAEAQAPLIEVDPGTKLGTSYGDYQNPNGYYFGEIHTKKLKFGVQSSSYSGIVYDLQNKQVQLSSPNPQSSTPFTHTIKLPFSTTATETKTETLATQEWVQSEDVAVGTQTTGGATHIEMKFWKGTQAQYDSITTKDSDTFYIIVG